MKTFAIGLYIMGFFSAISFSQTPEANFTINYISAENVYINGGKLDGLSVGDTLIVYHNNTKVAVLNINYTADHSSACVMMLKRGKAQPGDLVRPISHREMKQASVERKTRRRKTTSRKSGSSRAHAARLSGNVSFQWYHIEDLSDGGYNFDQSGMRLNLKAKNIFSQHFNFRLKTRGRYNQRSRRFNSAVPQTEWRNRIYTAIFSYDDDDAMFNFKLGRIISNVFSGIGYIDGLLLQQNLTNTTRYGVFAGTQPEWQYADFQTSIQKYGAYANYIRGAYGKRRYEATLAMAGEYHSTEVSREFLYAQNSYSDKRFNLYQSAELEINRDWRKTRSGESVSLSNLYINASWNVMNWLTTGLSFDNRKNYYTYQVRSLADSLFDDAMRYGLRWNINARLPGNYRVFANAGLRARETDTENTYSFAGGVSKTNITSLRLYINCYGSGFLNYFADGYHSSLRLGKRFRNGHDMNISYGNYTYILGATNTTRMNQWLRVNSMLQLFQHFYLSENYEYIWGNDSPGHRIYAEIGYRF